MSFISSLGKTVSFISSFARKTKGWRPLYLQILFVILVFTLTIVVSGVFVNNLIKEYMDREAMNRLTQTQIRIMDELREPETLLIPIERDIRDIITAGGTAGDVQEYLNEISAELLKKEDGFIFDGFHSYFEALGNEYIAAPGWPIPEYYNPLERPWYKAAVEGNGKLSITPLYTSMGTGEYIFSLGSRIFDAEGNPLGVVSVSVEFSNITNFVKEMNVHEGGRGLLADENYIVVVPPDPAVLGWHMYDVAPAVRRVAEIMEQGENYAYVEGKNYWGVESIFYAIRMDNDWILYFLVPKNVYFMDLRNLMFYFGALGIVMMLVIIFILIRIDIAQAKTQNAASKMKETVEEKNRLAYFGNIMNSLDTMIYVTNPATNEILFINDNMKKHFGIEGDVTGQICYKVLQNDIDERCNFCPCFQLDMDPDSTVVWEEHGTLKNRFYRNVDKYINWPNGKTAHLQHSIDISDLKAMTNTLNNHLGRQSLMTYISQSFLSTEDMNVLITKVLKEIGEFMGIDQILMFETEDNENSYTCKNEWLNPQMGLSTRVGEVLTMNKSFHNLFIKAKVQKLTSINSNDPDTKKAMAKYRVNFRNNYIVTFIFIGNELSAMIDFSRKDSDKPWDKDEISLAAYITNIFTGALNMREAERQLITAKEAAEQSNRSKGIFLAHMSHEIRTPMNAILGTSEIQLQDKTLPPDREEAFRQIYDSGNLLLNIINDILDFSKIEAGKMEIVPAKYNIPSMINDTVQLNLLRYESKPLEFFLDLDEKMPFELYGDELRIKQILNNLLSNAFKYTHKGEIKLSVYAEEGKDEETMILVFRVSDTGQGMSEDQINKLFDEYSRFNLESNHGVSGTGLGMSIVKRLVELMGGEIFVESRLGEGSIFTVLLPQKIIGSIACGAEFADNLRNFRFRSTPNSKKAQIIHEYMPYGSVLVVDDVASNLYVAKGLLTPYGLRIESVSSGIEAIERIKAGSVYDIVFMDHMMPVMDGMEALKIIRDSGYTRPVVALTANAVVGQSEIFLANGFDGFISKPIDSRELDAALRRFIRDRQPREVIEATRRERLKREIENPEGPAQEVVKDMSEIEKYFILDAESAIKMIEDVYAKLKDSDARALNSYTTAVHGMKNVLANMGEPELSSVALRLEQAGRENDLGVISEETEAFLNALKFLIDKYKPADNGETVEISGEDAVYLRDKLLEIKTACGAFDVTAAKETLDSLRQKTWPRYVNDSLDEISVHLLHSAFRKAEAVAEKTAKI